MTAEQQSRIGLRIKAFREQNKLSQDQLAAAMQLEHRQTLAAIESGTRAIQPGELTRAAEALGVSLDAFVDPYRLVGEGEFNFRAKDVAAATLLEFEQRAGQWIATFRELARRLGRLPSPLGVKLELAKESSFEEARALAEVLVREWDLGNVPAERLAEAIEARVGTLVLYVDAPQGISGAASHLPRFNTILVNRNEAAGRRNFDLAHELFHILTWDAMPPDRVEGWETRKVKGNRVEMLADNFAGALLMPEPVVARAWASRPEGDLERWIERTAASLRVSGDALKWRLVTLNLLSKSQAGALTPSPARKEPQPPLFGRRFVGMVAEAVDDGILSLRRAAGLLGLSVFELGELCATHGFRLSYDLSE